MRCASNQNQYGFTLVEISIVMIIIGLLIGGTFGGMKLIENMHVNKTVQDLKAIESAALTFKDAYGRLPGDLRNPSSRLPNCTVAPCVTGGDGNRQLVVNFTDWLSALTAVDERFVFWHHLQAADLLSMDYHSSTNLEFGDGQPTTPIGGGYRIAGNMNGSSFWATAPRGHFVFLGGEPDGAYHSESWYISGPRCSLIRALDSKVDDARPTTGRLFNPFCIAGPGDWTDPTNDWSTSDAASGTIYIFGF